MQRGTHTAVHRSQDRVASIPTLPKASIATPDELAGYDAIVFGAPTRFGNVSS
jgi:multimeric flavodoxin WrbA